MRTESPADAANAISSSAAVGPIVVREQQTSGVQLLNRCEEAAQERRIVEIGRGLPDAAVNLQQRRAAEPVLAASQIDQQ
jgi:hypothetical protein